MGMADVAPAAGTTELARDLGVLSSLVHFGWLNTQQLQALCFPGAALATVRTTLHAFEEANWIQHVRWRIGPPDGGYIWAVRRKGIRILTQYFPIVPQIVTDLARPSSALEQEEWRVQLLIRTFVTRFVVEARRHPLLAACTVTLPPQTWQPDVAGPHLEPGARLAIVWDPPTRHEPSWLPWTSIAPLIGRPTQYALYCDRQVPAEQLKWLVAGWVERARVEQHIPVLLLNNAERYCLAIAALAPLRAEQPMRLTTWPDLQHSIVRGLWRDERGSAIPLQPT